MNTIIVSIIFDQPSLTFLNDLSPNCLQKLSADDSDEHRHKRGGVQLTNTWRHHTASSGERAHTRTIAKAKYAFQYTPSNIDTYFPLIHTF